MPHSSIDTIVVNADIRSMDPLQPRAQALAIGSERVVALGANDEIRALARPGAKVIDAEQRLVLPGFQDTHIHLQDSGLEHAFNLKLDHLESPAHLQQLLREFAAANPDRKWLIGGGWNFGMFSETTLTRDFIDAAVPDRPVFMRDNSYHSAIVNSKALEVMGVTGSTPNPNNGVIVHDTAGEPTGMLYEEAMNLAYGTMPKYSDADYAEGVRWGQKHCNKHGITGVLDARVDERHMRVYQMLDKAHELTVRVAATASVDPPEKVEEALARVDGLRRDYTSGMVRLHSAKFFVDGIVENRTAAMLENYSDARGGNAPTMFGESHLRELFIAFDAARFQIHVHTIGDKAVRASLDAIEAARHVNGYWPSLHQLAHVQFIDPADIPRFRELGVVANMQLLWASNDPSVTQIAAGMVGPERTKWIYAMRSLIDAGAPYALSSDWGVSTLNPFPIMQTAILRKARHMGWETPAFMPNQTIDIHEAVKGYTINAAEAAWRSQDTGSLSVGKYADLIMLDRDIFETDPYELGGTKVLLTLLGGKEVHRA